MKISLCLTAALLLQTPVWAQDVPLVAHYPLEPNATPLSSPLAKGGERGVLTDAGPLKLNGTIGKDAKFVPGKVGQALQFSRTGDARAAVGNVGLIGKLGDKLTVTAWVKIDDYKDAGGIIAKRRDNVAAPFSLSIGKEGQLGFEGNNGAGWESLFSNPKAAPTGEWFHLAFTYEAGGEARFFVNTKQVASKKMSRALASNDQDFILGSDPFRGPFGGALDEVKLFAAALSPAQIQSEMNGQAVPVRAAKNEDFPAPSHPVSMALVRFDQPIGAQEGYGRTRRAAQKVAGPDAFDWPQITLDGKPVFMASSEERRDLPLREKGQERPLFQQTYDQVLQPGNHWLRAVQWMWGQRYAYTTDRTARTWHNDYELWTFPILIKGAGENAVKDVVLKYNGGEIYRNAGPLRSLTLVLPQSEIGKKYEISVAGRAAVAFEAGLQPIIVGAPKEALIPVNFTLEGEPKITVSNAPLTFGNTKEWDEDLAAMRAVQLPQNAKDVLATRLKSVAFSGEAGAVPLAAYYPMEPAKNPSILLDFGPSQLDGTLQDGALYDGGGKRDNALRLNGNKARAIVEKAAALTSPGGAWTFSAWVRPEGMPRPDTSAFIASTRAGWHTTKPWSLRLSPDANWGFEGHDGGWQQQWSESRLKTGVWQHVLMSFAPGGDVVFYLDGKQVKRAKAPQKLTGNGEPLVFGYEEGGDFPGGARSGFQGLIDEAKFYAAALTPEQVQADLNGTLPVRAPEGITPRVRDLALLAAAPATAPPTTVPIANANAPRSPISIYAINPPHGMGGGAFYFGGEHLKKFSGSVSQYADYLANLGIDGVWEKQWNDEYARALNEKNIQFGFIPGTSWGRPFLANPNIAFLAANLPDHHAPLYRDLQVTAQKLKKYPNFAGLSIGADNGGYVSFWDWAPPIPNRPWGEAFVQFQTPLNPPLARGDKGGLEFPLPKHMGGKATTREFVDYIARYDATFKQYGYFAEAVRGVDPKLKFFSGSFGSSPGVGGRGGWPWATVPGQPMHEGLDVMQAYDWNELSSSKPMHLPALIDRLKSYHPEKAAWGLVDDFRLFFGREARQRAYALALTRGIESIGTTFLAAPTGDEAKPQIIAEQKELFSWIHKYGGVYKGTRPLASVGVLYVHPQALLRRANQDNNAPDDQILRASHEGKTTEAYWLCHAAGWPAKIVTPEELKRGLAPEMKVLLLTGLNRFDETWAWSDGLETQLKAFVAGGGKIILDDESVVPQGIAATAAGLQIRAYVPQSDTDWTPKLFARNRDNIQKLRAALNTAEKPFVTSDEPTIWAIPHQTGDVQYVTVVNWGYEDGKNASQVVKPQTGKLIWNTTRPIYDLRGGKKLSPQEAQSVDLTKDGFAVFALPASEARVPLDGQFVTLLNRKLAPPRTTISMGLRSGGIFHSLSFSLADYEAFKQFVARKTVPLVIALTPEQQADAKMQAVAKKLSDYYAQKGRNATIRSLAPGDVIESLQPLDLQKFPRWKTIDADLILLGNTQNNPLLYDQSRGGLLSAESGVSVTFSPFVGERQVLNIVANDVVGLEQGVQQIAFGSYLRVLANIGF